MRASLLLPTRRWTLDDFDDWLLSRLKFRWQGDERHWRGKLAGYAGSNDFLFIMNEEAVMLAFRMSHVMSGKPVVMEAFAFSRNADLKDNVWGFSKGADDGGLRALYKTLKEWAKEMGATRSYVGVCTDITPYTLKEFIGEGAYYIVGSP